MSKRRNSKKISNVPSIRIEEDKIGKIQNLSTFLDASETDRKSLLERQDYSIINIIIYEIVGNDDLENFQKYVKKEEYSDHVLGCISNRSMKILKFITEERIFEPEPNKFIYYSLDLKNMEAAELFLDKEYYKKNKLDFLKYCEKGNADAVKLLTKFYPVTKEELKIFSPIYSQKILSLLTKI